MANEYEGYSNTDWARTASTTLADHIREVEPAWMRNFAFGAMLESRGLITYNHGGRGFDWPVEYRRGDVEGNTGETPRNFTRKNRWKKAQLEYRGYQATDLIYEKEVMENRGESAIVKVYDDMVGRLETDLKHALATEWYIDGNATGNTQLWHGLESFMGGTQTVNSSTGAARTANAADFALYSNDTYANLVTTLANYDGENETGAVWPEGVADSEFDFWTPLTVNTTCTGFSPATHTWAAQGDEALRFAIIHSQRNSSPDGQVDTVLLTRTSYYGLLNLFDNKEQIHITSENELRALGFKNTFIFDGATVTWEMGVPVQDANSKTVNGYGVNFKCIELRCMYDTIYKSEGPEYDMDSQGYKTAVKTLSNLKFSSPRNFFALKQIA